MKRVRRAGEGSPFFSSVYPFFEGEGEGVGLARGRGCMGGLLFAGPFFSGEERRECVR